MVNGVGIVHYLAVIGVLSMDEFEAVRTPFVPAIFPLVCGCKMGVEAFLGVEEPNPTGVGREVCLPPLRIDDDLRMPDPPGLSSELSEMFDPVLQKGHISILKTHLNLHF